MASIRRAHESALQVAEWTSTIAFTLEYGFRLASVDGPLRNATSFFGLAVGTDRSDLRQPGDAGGAGSW